MAAILFDRDQLWDALEQYQLAVRFTNRKEIALPALINSGKILMKLGDYKTAGMRFAAALQIDPGNNTALSLYQQVSRQEEH
jgi:tetratricopeptide (TPR) repeat protein